MRGRGKQITWVWETQNKGKVEQEREGERKLGKSMTEERKEGAEKSKGGDREGGWGYLFIFSLLANQ